VNSSSSTSSIDKSNLVKNIHKIKRGFSSNPQSERDINAALFDSLIEGLELQEDHTKKSKLSSTDISDTNFKNFQDDNTSGGTSRLSGDRSTANREQIREEFGFDPARLLRMNILKSRAAVPGTTIQFAGDALIEEDIENLKKKLNEGKTQLDELQWLHLYPERVKNCEKNGKTPLGFFDFKGHWISTGVNIPDIPKEQREAHKKNKKVVEKTLGPTQQDLVGKYRYGVTSEELEGMPDKLKEVFSFTNANRGEINFHRIVTAIKKFRNSEYDTGSAGVQVAIMSERVRYMTDHLKKHRKDQITVRTLKMLLDKRRKMMAYLKYKDGHKYAQILKYYGIKDAPTIIKIKPIRPFQIEG